MAKREIRKRRGTKGKKQRHQKKKKKKRDKTNPGRTKNWWEGGKVNPSGIRKKGTKKKHVRGKTL